MTVDATDQFTPRPSHTGLVQRVLARLKRLQAERTLTCRPSFILGFSGGTDSLALASIFSTLRPVVPFDVELVHIDHRLRPASATDAALAGDLAETLGLPFRLVTVPISPSDAHPGVGVEEAARRMRYVALAERAFESGTDYVVTAHQRDDQAETVLLHLLRGAGLSGAAAMREVSTLSIPWWTDGVAKRAVTIWRPLIDEPRANLEAFVRERGLTPTSSQPYRYSCCRTLEEGEAGRRNWRLP